MSLSSSEVKYSLNTFEMLVDGIRRYKKEQRYSRQVHAIVLHPAVFTSLMFELHEQEKLHTYLTLPMDGDENYRFMGIKIVRDPMVDEPYLVTDLNERITL